MTLIIETFLSCDRCGTTFGADNRERTGLQQREHATANGWLCKKSRDYCEDCTKIIENNKHDKQRTI